MFHKSGCFFFPTTFVAPCLRSTEIGERDLYFIGLPTQEEWKEFLFEVDNAILMGCCVKGSVNWNEEDILYYLGR